MNDSLLSALPSVGNGSVIWMFFANPLDLRFLLCSVLSSGEGRGVRVRVRGLGDTSSPKPQNQRVYRGIDSLIWLLHPNRASFGGGGKHVKIIASFYFSISFLKISCKVAFLKKDIYIYIIYEHIYRFNLTLVITPKIIAAQIHVLFLSSVSLIKCSIQNFAHFSCHPRVHLSLWVTWSIHISVKTLGKVERQGPPW